MISIVVPAYNEQWRIPAMLSEIECFIEKHPGLIFEVIVVDDGSRDATVERCMYFSQRLPLRMERLMQNEGKWTAIRHGISVARTDAVLILDADGSASVFELESLNLDTILRSKIVVWGTRFSKLSTVEGKSILRSIVSHGYKLYVSECYWLARGKWSVIQDFQCPWKLIYKSDLGRELVAERFSGDLDLALARSKGTLINHPVNFVHKAGGSIRLKTVWSMAVETLRVVRFQRKFDKAVKTGTMSLDVANGEQQ
jgi:glycosyltransferase involved in cell wall biosynthesis